MFLEKLGLQFRPATRPYDWALVKFWTFQKIFRWEKEKNLQSMESASHRSRSLFEPNQDIYAEKLRPDKRGDNWPPVLPGAPTPTRKVPSANFGAYVTWYSVVRWHPSWNATHECFICTWEAPQIIQQRTQASFRGKSQQAGGLNLSHSVQGNLFAQILAFMGVSSRVQMRHPVSVKPKRRGNLGKAPPGHPKRTAPPPSPAHLHDCCHKVLQKCTDSEPSF